MITATRELAAQGSQRPIFSRAPPTTSNGATGVRTGVSAQAKHRRAARMCHLLVVEVGEDCHRWQDKPLVRFLA
jgi:hypothetical protein